MSEILFSAQTSDGQSVKTFTQSENERVITVIADGTFNGATVKLQYSRDGSEWIDHADITFTAAGSSNVQVARETQLRGDVSGSGASTSVGLELKF